MRAVLGIKGEPSTPDDASQGLVWRSIVGQIERAGAQDEFTSVSDVPRSTFNTHPWSIGGGGAAELKGTIEEGSSLFLSDLAVSIGPASFAGTDDMFFSDESSLNRQGVDKRLIRKLVTGESLRDWAADCDAAAIVPYDQNQQLLPYDRQSSWGKYVWLTKRQSEGMVSFNRQTREMLGEPWWSWYRWIPERYRTPLSISFAFVSTHNHFVLDRGEKVFKQTAPLIRLSADATVDDYLSLLGLLNCSTACFWMHQVFHNKGRPGANAAAADERWEFRFEHDGTKLHGFPIPNPSPIDFARSLDSLAQEYICIQPEERYVAPHQLLTLWRNPRFEPLNFVVE